MRHVADLLSTDTPLAALWTPLAASLAALLGAERVVVVLRDEAGRRVAFDSAHADDCARDGVAAGALADEVLERGDTIARMDDELPSVGAPIRFANAVLGALVLAGVRADLAALPLLESCALYIGVRLHNEGVLEETQRYVRLALTDALTGIANRRKFDQTLESEWARAQRDGAPLAVVMVDVDYFKAFNDHYGHQAGDLCLQQVAHALAESMQRPADLLARYGGEEFAAILPATDAAGATALAERLRATLEHLKIVHGASSLGFVSLSAGVAATVATADLTPADLVAQADEALYDAKIDGRNRVRAAGDLAHARPVEAHVPAGPRGNLPTELTPLVGRLGEVAEIRSLLDTNRLVTVVGAGGIGKTRVAVRAAAGMMERYADGVWFVDLAELTEPALVAGAFARAFGERAHVGAVASDQLARALAAKHALVVVDNCEHLLAAAASVMAALVRACPQVSVLATSREPLGIVGESRYRLPLLSLPAPDSHLSAYDALRADAVALFVERARAVRPSFAVDDGNAAQVAAIVRRLDGIALAIELAAARIEVGGLDALAARLDQRFRLLSGNDASALPRQRTMRATLDWSFDLLSPAEQTLLRRLAVFAGEFPLDAVEAVCADECVPAIDVSDVFVALVRKSLVVDDSGDATRFTLLETVRAYGRERLAAAGEIELLARRHARHYAERAERFIETYAASPTRQWLAAARAHEPNYRAALEWSLGAHNDDLVGARLAAALLTSLGDREADEGIRWVQAALDALEPGVHPSVEAHLCLRLANSERGLTADRLREAGLRAVNLYRSLDEPVRFTNALRVLAQVLYWYFPRERADAQRFAEEAIAVARASGDQLAIAAALKTRALLLRLSDIAGKRELMEECLALSRRYGNDLQVGSVLSWMSEMEFVAGENIVRALGYGRAALRYAETSGSRMRLEISAANLAMYAAGAGEWKIATATAARALRLSLESRSPAGITWAIQALACVAAGLGEYARAARLLAFCDARCASLHSPRQADQGEDVSARRLRLRLSTAMAAADLGRELQAGSGLTEEAAVAQALALER